MESDSSILYGLAAWVGVGLRALDAVRACCLYVGRKLSDLEAGRGFQDAVTPPWLTNWTLVLWGGLVGLLSYAAWDASWKALGISLLYAIGFYAGLGLLWRPASNSSLILRLIFRSMVKRLAAFEAHRDEQRAGAMSLLVARFQERIQLL